VVEPAAPAISAGFFKNFPDQASEPGAQPFDPFEDPRRHYWRGAGVVTCQTFGLKIESGCLLDFLNGAPNPFPFAAGRMATPPGQLPGDAAPQSEAPAAPGVGEAVEGILGGGSAKNGSGRGGGAGDLLDFLLGP